MDQQTKYTASLAFEPIKLPPVTDILVLAKQSPHGKAGIVNAFQFIAPDEFEMIEVNDEDPVVEAVLVHKRILKRLEAAELLHLLKQHVFPFVSKGEAIKVDLSIKIIVEGIQGGK